jgi:hypothetical protein
VDAFAVAGDAAAGAGAGVAPAGAGAALEGAAPRAPFDAVVSATVAPVRGALRHLRLQHLDALPDAEHALVHFPEYALAILGRQLIETAVGHELPYDVVADRPHVDPDAIRIGRRVGRRWHARRADAGRARGKRRGRRRRCAATLRRRTAAA